MSADGLLVAGVDGCPAGWVAAVGAVDNGDLWLTFAATFEELVALHPHVVCWAIDIPIGLADDGPRECDALARQRLGRKRGSSVFPAPPRAVSQYVSQGGGDYQKACHVAAAATGKKISKQAWNITPKIAEVRDFLSDMPRRRNRFFESHPELCFARLAGGQALAAGKKTTEGHLLRRRLLEEVVGKGCIDRLVTQTAATRGIGVDDTIDAIACWTAASRQAEGTAESLPSKPSNDADGLSMAIVC